MAGFRAGGRDSSSPKMLVRADHGKILRQSAVWILALKRFASSGGARKTLAESRPLRKIAFAAFECPPAANAWPSGVIPRRFFAPIAFRRKNSSIDKSERERVHQTSRLSSSARCSVHAAPSRGRKNFPGEAGHGRRYGYAGSNDCPSASPPGPFPGPKGARTGGYRPCGAGLRRKCGDRIDQLKEVAPLRSRPDAECQPF